MMMAVCQSSKGCPQDPVASNPVETSVNERLDSVEISLITCEPFDVVYALYGHTGIRINDRASGQDMAVNYGVFDKTKPNFIPRFVLGLTDYTMSFLPLDLFLMEYRYFGSWVREQVLNLNNAEKLRVIAALEENYRPENREYRYNFFYNNCTSKARDIIVKCLDGEVEYKAAGMQQGERSFRELIHWKNHDYPWAALGNDMLLGVGSDLNTTMEERQFLPEVMMTDFDNAYIINKDGTRRKLVKEANMILPHGQSQAEPMGSFPLTPTALSIVITLAVAAFTWYERKCLKHTVKVFDYVYFLVFGILGLVLTAMLFSEHPTVRVNLQILLFSPLWLGMVWFLHKNPRIPIIGIVLVAAFYAGALVQSYAEGVMILASSLLIRLVNARKSEKVKE